MRSAAVPCRVFCDRIVPAAALTIVVIAASSCGGSAATSTTSPTSINRCAISMKDWTGRYQPMAEVLRSPSARRGNAPGRQSWSRLQLDGHEAGALADDCAPRERQWRSPVRCRRDERTSANRHDGHRGADLYG